VKEPVTTHFKCNAKKHSSTLSIGNNYKQVQVEGAYHHVRIRTTSQKMTRLLLRRS